MGKGYKVKDIYKKKVRSKIFFAKLAFLLPLVDLNNLANEMAKEKKQQNMNKASHHSRHLLGNRFPFLLLDLQQFLPSTSYCCV